MNRLYSLLGLAAVIVASTGAPAYADRIGPVVARPVDQVIQAEVIVVGKVADLEKDLVRAAQSPGGPKVGYQVATVKITEGLAGAKGVTHVRVGFVPAPAQPNGFEGKGRRLPNYAVSQNLTSGQEGCLFLRKHPEEDFYVQTPNGTIIDKSRQNYDKELERIKRYVKAIEDPMASLKAKETIDRQTAACLLVIKYRSYPPVASPKAQVKQEAIPAEESKLILQTLAEMEWGKFDPNGVANLSNVFYLLNLTPNDGFKQPRARGGEDFNKIMSEAVGRWMKESASKYTIRRYTVSPGK